MIFGSICYVVYDEKLHLFIKKRSTSNCMFNILYRKVYINIYF